MRDIMLKLTHTDTDEYRIYRELLRFNESFGDDFPGVLLPVAILDTPYDFSFVVMPR